MVIIPTTTAEGAKLILARSGSEKAFRTGGLVTVLRDDAITHYHTNLYTGALDLNDFAVAILAAAEAPGVTDASFLVAAEAL
tara:strand:- start:3568 stop:3813 length:246 start_codon:yes stop_codon:yes gene_type:complete